MVASNESAPLNVLNGNQIDVMISTVTTTRDLLTEVEGDAAGNHIDSRNGGLDLVDGGAGNDSTSRLRIT